MTYRKRFQSLSRSAKYRPLVAFDCEGIGGESGFLCGSVVSAKEICFFTDRNAMLDYLCQRRHAGALITAHNLDYDLALLTGGDLRVWDLLYADSRLLTATLRDAHKKKWTFIDSQNLFVSFSVADLGKVLGLHKLNLSENLMNKITAGCAWDSLDLFEQNDLRSYNVRDSEIVFAALSWLQHELNELGGQMSSTIAGCTMDLFRRSYLDTAWDTPNQTLNDWYRDAFYGARTEPLKLGQLRHMNGYDFTSLYPSVQMTVDFPHPDYFAVDDKPAHLSDFDDKQGMAHVTVFVKDCHIPPLPVRYEKRLFFPTGKLTGTWTLLELRHALNHGVDLLDLDYVVYSRVSFNPFTEFITDLFSRRAVYKRDSDHRERIFKLLLNSAYGRFGIRVDNSLQRLISIDENSDWDELAGGQFVEYNGWPYVIYPVAEAEQPFYCCVPIAAQIAAAARVRLHSTMLAVDHAAAYVDTDSIFSSVRLPTGEGLGELREEFVDSTIDIVAAKEYRITRPDMSQVAHVKGVPVALRDDYLRGLAVTFDSPVTIKEAVTKNDVAGRWLPHVKQRREIMPKRALEAPFYPSDLWNPTRPWTWRELTHWPLL